MFLKNNLILYAFLVLLLIYACSSNVSIKKYDFDFTNCMTESDSSILEILDLFENYLLEKKYLEDRSSNSYYKLWINSNKNEFEIPRQEIIKSVFNNSYKGWFYFDVERESVLRNCLINLNNNKTIDEIHKKSILLLIRNNLLLTSNIEHKNEKLILSIGDVEVNYFDSKMFKYCFLWNLCPIR